MSNGKLLKVIGHIKVILVATAYMISNFWLSHKPSNLERTSNVLNSFRFSISVSGSQNSFMKETSTGIHGLTSSWDFQIFVIFSRSITSLSSVQRTRKNAFIVTLKSISSIFGISLISIPTFTMVCVSLGISNFE